MTRNLKALGLALLAICAMGAVVAQGASAANDDFHSDGQNTIITGNNVGVEKFQVGAAGTVECAKSEFESQLRGGELVSANTYKKDTITVIPRYTECTFGGQPATVKFNHCAYIFYSETTKGNTHPVNEEKEHANVEIQCAINEDTGLPTSIEIHTALCTITVGPQTVKHAVRYENEVNKSSITIKATAQKIKVSKLRTTESQSVNGCLTFPTGEVGVYTGTATAKCFKDEGASEITGTNKTTPKGLYTQGATTECTVKGA